VQYDTYSDANRNLVQYSHGNAVIIVEQRDRHLSEVYLFEYEHLIVVIHFVHFFQVHCLPLGVGGLEQNIFHVQEQRWWLAALFVLAMLAQCDDFEGQFVHFEFNVVQDPIREARCFLFGLQTGSTSGY
jgi:hypothetical protein